MGWRIALLAALVALALALWAAGGVDALEPARVGRLLRESGAWGPLLFVLAFSLANGLGAPGALFLLPAIAVWPTPQAFLLVWAGAIGAGVVGYAFARGIGRDFVEARLPARLRDLDERASRNAVRTVVGVRLTLFLLGPAHWALGLSSIRPGKLLVGSVLGFLPGAAFWTFAGGELFDAVRGGSAAGWLVVLALVTLPLALARLLSRSRSR